MNLFPFVRFRKSSRINKVFRIIRGMRKDSVFRKARFDIYSPCLSPKRLIVVFGQMHTVWSGNINNRQRKKIVACQARLGSYYAYFHSNYDVTRFGGEGIYEGLELIHLEDSLKLVYSRVLKEFSTVDLFSAEQVFDISRKVFSILGKEWHEALRDKNMDQVQRLASALSGQSFYHYLSHGKAKAYPIESEKAYQNVLQGINHLSDQIESLERNSTFIYVKQRGGKVKTEQENQVVLQHNLLVKEFNRLIGSDMREQATFEILKQKSNENDIVIFTMGVAHRKNYLHLVNEALKNTDIAFVFVTPPELLINLWIVLGTPFVVLLVLLFLNYFSF